MKKLLLVLAVASFTVACNNSSKKTEKTGDTTIVTPPDSLNAPVDTLPVVGPVDTTKNPLDTTK